MGVAGRKKVRMEGVTLTGTGKDVGKFAARIVANLVRRFESWLGEQDRRFLEVNPVGALEDLFMRGDTASIIAGIDHVLFRAPTTQRDVVFSVSPETGEPRAVLVQRIPLHLLPQAWGKNPTLAASTQPDPDYPDSALVDPAHLGASIASSSALDKRVILDLISTLIESYPAPLPPALTIWETGARELTEYLRPMIHLLEDDGEQLVERWTATPPCPGFDSKAMFTRSNLGAIAAASDSLPARDIILYLAECARRKEGTLPGSPQPHRGWWMVFDVKGQLHTVICSPLTGNIVNPFALMELLADKQTTLVLGEMAPFLDEKGG